MGTSLSIVFRRWRRRAARASSFFLLTDEVFKLLEDTGDGVIQILAVRLHGLDRLLQMQQANTQDYYIV
jgi:hypothetical protein